MNKKRARTLTDHKFMDGPILYWMDRDMRVNHNWALTYAQDLAQERGESLIIAYNLVTNFLGGTLHQWLFKLEGLKEIAAECHKKDIPFFILHDKDGTDSPSLISTFVHTYRVGAVVTDFSPLRIQRKWKEKVAHSLSCPLIEVDAHNIVPVWVASQKQEYGAYTLRPKLYKLLPEYLDTLPLLQKQKKSFKEIVPEIPWKELYNNPYVRRDIPEITWITPGEKAAQKTLESFLLHTLPIYAEKRNDPLADAQSHLSPYLHYGMISAQHIVHSVLNHIKKPIQTILDSKSNAAATPNTKASLTQSAAAFLEELIVRRELSDNFCLYNTHYDSVEGFPLWAQKSHALHTKDTRAYTYTQKEFENAETHDELWNACQKEMILTGKMHGYMRMYWAKKILEWTKTPKDALRIAIYLNDTYELDGRDPNGYTGIAWSIGGVHDRAWFTRPIFGQIRYMARSGCDKKFDTKAYIAKYLTSTTS